MSMTPRRRKLLREIMDLLFRIDIVQILDRVIGADRFGAGIRLPLKYKGRRCKIVVYE